MHSASNSHPHGNHDLDIENEGEFYAAGTRPDELLHFKHKFSDQSAVFYCQILFARTQISAFLCNKNQKYPL